MRANREVGRSKYALRGSPDNHVAVDRQEVD
jgi:hypothetical protein